MLVLAYLVATNGPILAIVGFAMVAASGSTFFYPAIGAYLPSLAADERQLGPANSAWASIGNLSFIVGPAIGGVLIAAGDVVIAFLLNGLSFLVIAAILWTLPPSRPGDRKAAEAADRQNRRPRRSRAPATTSSEPAPAAPPAASPWSQLPLRPVSGLVLIQFVIGFFDGGIQAFDGHPRGDSPECGRTGERVPQRRDRRRRADRRGRVRRPRPASPPRPAAAGGGLPR